MSADARAALAASPAAGASAASAAPAVGLGVGIDPWAYRGIPRSLVLQAADAAPLPGAVDGWIAALSPRQVVRSTADGALEEALRARPRAALLDARGAGCPAALEACRRLKADAYTGVVPCVVLVDADGAAFGAAFAAGADEVLREGTPEGEVHARLAALLRRADRDLAVHPTTRLPGTPEIEEELARRLRAAAPFAACYADLDHFKEFNDRYGYTEGDRVIRMLALMLHDVVKGSVGEAGFVGHIGGDDFLFVVPLPAMRAVCDTLIETFDLVVPLQYSDADRRAGYYFGKDRRGRLHRVPLMTLSIGVATTERRVYGSPAQVGRLASEMKSYAKTQPGSLYAVDRRHDALAVETVGAAPHTLPPAPVDPTP